MQFSWQILEKPFFVLAPMEGATDTVFRQIVIDCGRPDVVFTEFTNTDGILSEGADHVGQRLVFDKREKPIIAQIWGTNPESYEKSAELIKRLGFDGIDINMGCPEKSIVKRGSCAGLIKNPEVAREVISATKRGAGELPVSVKTRIGFSSIDLEWIEFLLKQNLDALTVHLRTRKEMSKVPAHWEIGKEIVKLKEKISPQTLLIGNGDVKDIHDAKKKIKLTGFDGIMIGRGVFQNPYAFSELVKWDEVKPEDKIKLLLKHLDLFEKTWKDKKSFLPLKRYFKIYISGFDGANALRERLMETKSVDEAREILID